MKTMKKAKTWIGELAFLGVTAICWLPIYYFVIGAFKERRDIVKYPLVINGDMFTTENFAYVWKRMNFLKTLGNTAFITVVSLLIVIVCASLAGFAIARIKRKSFAAFYSALVALMVVPFIGCVISLVVLTNRMGLYDTLWGCILIQAAWNMPFATFLYAGFMGGLPKELEEAAYIDGCSTFQTYARIFFPLQAPITATCCIRSGIGIWNDYLVSSSLLNSAKTPTLMVGIRQFFGQYVSEYGYAFAGIILASLPIVIAFVLLQKYFIKGLVAGAVKG